MALDLKKDIHTLRRHITQRIKDYPVYINEGPGRDEDPISQITIGFDYLQDGWIAVIFDTRPEPSCDGEWSKYLEANLIAVPAWTPFFNKQYESKQCQYTSAEGGKTTLQAQGDEARLAAIIGDTLKSKLSSWADKGVLDKLPLVDNCLLCVEHSEGYYGWSNQQACEDSEEPIRERLIAEAVTLPKDKQIDYWVGVLDRVARGEQHWGYLVSDTAIESLEDFGQQAIIPLLKFVSRWSSKEEFIGDRPKRKIEDAAHNAPIFDAIHAVFQSSVTTPEAEKLLNEIVRKSIKANAKRKLWGTTPAWAARCLHKHFSGYPQPSVGDSDNRLKNAEAFVKKPKRS